jgi:preprotein translocase subunit SecE
MADDGKKGSDTVLTVVIVCAVMAVIFFGLLVGMCGGFR